MKTNFVAPEESRGRSSFRFILLICVVVCIAYSASFASFALFSAASQSRLPDESVSDAATAPALVDSVVADVQGTSIRTDGGLLIDVSTAFIFSIGGERLDSSFIKPGMRVRFSLRASDDVSSPPSSPMIANVVQLRLENEVVLVGTVQALDDPPNASITILNRRIPISEAGIVFSSRHRKIKAGRVVTVVARAEGNDLVATTIYLDDPYPFIGAGIL